MDQSISFYYIVFTLMYIYITFPTAGTSDCETTPWLEELMGASGRSGLRDSGTVP